MQQRGEHFQMIVFSFGAPAWQCLITCAACVKRPCGKQHLHAEDIIEPLLIFKIANFFNQNHQFQFSTFKFNSNQPHSTV